MASSFDNTAINIQQLGITKHEAASYERLWVEVSNGTASVTGAAAKDLFTSTHLAQKVLSTIWILSDRQRAKMLSREDFYIAMRLVALAQNGIVPSVEAAYQHREVPLPIFGAAAEGYVKARAPSLAAAAGGPSSPRSGGAGFAPGGAGATAAVADEWAMSKEEHTSYLAHFTTADQDKDSFVSGPEAFAFFSSSGLSADVLRQIWYLADVGKDQKLDPDEFAIAVHLVRKIRGGSPIPTTLPDGLRPSHTSDGSAASPAVASPAVTIAPPQPQPVAAAPATTTAAAAPTDPFHISPEEKAAYFVHFSKADADGDGFVSGAEGFHFFTASSLDADVLRQIWFLADVGQDQKLDREEFAIALHLVRLYKSGLPLPSELPAAMRPRVAAPLVPSSSAVVPTAAAVTPAPTPSASSAAITQSEWYMSPEDRTGYQTHFATADKDQDGYITGPEAFGFFSSSGLDTGVLRSIWFLADVNKDNKLDVDEFAIALHLIRKIRGGSPLPATLPDALRISALGSAAASHVATPLSSSPPTPSGPAVPPPVIPAVPMSAAALVAAQIAQSYSASPQTSPAAQSTPTFRSTQNSALDLLSPGPLVSHHSSNPLTSGANDDPLDLLPRAEDQKVELEPLAPLSQSRTPTISTGSNGNAASPRGGNQLGFNPAPLSHGSPQTPAATPSAAVANDVWSMSAPEKQAYLGQFNTADKDQDGYVSGREAFEFFTSSGLDATVLRQIWYLADIDKDNRLDHDEFAIATHLVRKVRTGAAVPPSLPESLRPIGAGLTSLLGGGGGAGSVPSTPLSVPSSVAAASPPVTPSGNVGSLHDDHDDGWAISAAERAGYLTQFNTVDKDHDGFVSGAEAFAFFTSSGLEANILRQIWFLADYGKDQKLDPAEFAIAVHLVRKVRGGAVLPPSLPSSLIPGGVTQSAPISAPGSHQSQLPLGELGSAPPTPASTPAVGDQWAMSPAERAAYLQQFPTTDKDQDGYVSGPEARDFFASSGLDVGVLRAIWLLADMDGDNRLDQSEFAIAAHLTRRARTGVALPATLPPSLRASGMGQPLPTAATPTPTPTAAATTPGLAPPTTSAAWPGYAVMTMPGEYALPIPTSATDDNWAITPAERASYGAQFAKADGDNNGFVRGREGAAFFSQSGLDSGLLRKIWGLADVSEDGMLDREEFDIAVHLILKVRAGATLPDVLPAVLRPQPKEGSVPTPVAMAPTPVAATPAPTPVGAGEENKGEISDMDLLAGYSAPVSVRNASASPPITPRATFSASPPTAATSATGNDDGWSMTATDRAGYVQLFHNNDSDNDGFMGGREALEFFLKSGLDTPTLRSVWALSDLTSDGKLDVEEFSIAMHLIRKLRGGMPLPATLPSSLQPTATAAQSSPGAAVTTPLTSSNGSAGRAHARTSSGSTFTGLPLPAAATTPSSSSSSDPRLRSTSVSSQNGGDAAAMAAAAIARADRLEQENATLKAQIGELRSMVEQLMKR